VQATPPSGERLGREICGKWPFPSPQPCPIGKGRERLQRSDGKRKGGFTLFELLVVLVILSLMLVIIVPAFSTGSGTELKATARTLAAALRSTRNQAITHGLPLVFTLDVERRLFQMGGQQRVHRLPQGIDLSLYTAQSELLGEETGSIRFFPDGSSTGGRVTLSAKGRSYLVDVDWLTGKVSILSGASARGAVPGQSF
jgi:general secretion pathway protein H